MNDNTDEWKPTAYEREARGFFGEVLATTDGRWDSRCQMSGRTVRKSFDTKEEAIAHADRIALRVAAELTLKE